MKKQYCILDFETYSGRDIDFGSYEYSVHPSTDIICLAYAVGTLDDFRDKRFEVHSYTPHMRNKNIKAFLLFESLVHDPDTTLVAHNAFFDANILFNAFMVGMIKKWKSIPWHRWRCTSAQCAALGLPKSLGDAAIALELIEQKDKEGNRLMKKWAKPRKPSAEFSETRHLDLVYKSKKAFEELERIIEYCKSDIRVTANICSRLPLLSDQEQKLWELTQIVNMRGFRIDRPLVETAMRLLDIEQKRFDSELAMLTNGQVKSATKLPDMKKWLKSVGYEVDSLDKESIAAHLSKPQLPQSVRRVLEIRQEGGLSSTAKYQTIWETSQSDGRARGGLIYHTAGTGRWGGSIINPQNFPRGTISNSTKDKTLVAPGAAFNQAVDIVRQGDPTLVRLIYGDAMSVYSSILRGTLIPSEGFIFDVADYSQIEVRVLFWLARHRKGLEIFADKKRDIYIEAASEIFRKPISEIAKDSFERFVGKEQILGCGFAMGQKKFHQGMADKGKPIPEELAKRVVDIYRSSNKPVVNYWRETEIAAIKATLSPGRKVKAGFAEYESNEEFLFCTLPSGRRIAYQTPKVRYEMMKFKNEKQHVLYHWQLNPITKKRFYAGTYGGKLVQNKTQATARDIMAHAKLNIEASKIWKLVLSVHDEVIAERPIACDKNITDYLSLMKKLPEWARGVPIEAEGYTADRYRK